MPAQNTECSCCCCCRGGGGRGGWREGEGRQRVRQSGRLSGVWTCLAACAKQRKHTSTWRDRVARIGHVRLAGSPRRVSGADIVSFVGVWFPRRLEAGQLVHKHGTGRCSAQDSAPSLTPLLSPPPTRLSATAAAQHSACAARLLFFSFLVGLFAFLAATHLTRYTRTQFRSYSPAAAATALRHCSLCLKKPCFLLPRMTSRSARPIGRRQRSVCI